MINKIKKFLKQKKKFLIAGFIATGLVGYLFKDNIYDFLTNRFSDISYSPKLTSSEKDFVDGWRNLELESEEQKMVNSEFLVDVISENPKLESIVIENTSDKPIHNFWFYREGMPNFYSAKTIVESVTKDKKTQQEKVLALFELFPKFYNNFYPADDSGLLYEPSTLLSVFGWGQCNIATHNLETLCQMIGLETKGVGLELAGTGFAHKTMEVYFDGKWNYFDPDGTLFFEVEDGKIASLEDLKKNPNLIRNSSKTSCYDKEKYARALEIGKVEVYEYPEKFRKAQMQLDPKKYFAFRHIMRYDLLPGTIIQLFYDNKSKFFSRRKEQGEPPVYANGKLIWNITNKNLINFYKDKTLIIPVTNPYLLIDGEIRGETRDNSSINLLYLPFTKGPIYRPEWRNLGQAKGNFSFDLSDYIEQQPIFGYVLRISPFDKIKNLKIETDLQYNPRSLPYLSSGENKFFFYSPEKRSFKIENLERKSVVNVDNGIRIEFNYR